MTPGTLQSPLLKVPCDGRLWLWSVLLYLLVSLVLSDHLGELRRMWMWPSMHLLKMHTVKFGFGHLTKSRWGQQKGDLQYLGSSPHLDLSSGHGRAL